MADLELALTNQHHSSPTVAHQCASAARAQQGQRAGSVSFGEPRDFILRSNADITRKVGFSLGQGDLLVMRGATQQHWCHSVPKRKACGARINLTFRRIVQAEAVGAVEVAGQGVPVGKLEQVQGVPAAQTA